jgi:hypothetical protein
LISDHDLRAAVASGLLSESQAARLTALAHSRSGARENLDPGDEPFELFKGFNEIFIVVGLAILTAGWIAVNGLAVATEFVNYKTQATGATAVGAVFVWLISEYFIRRRRMVAPAIALSILFAANAFVGFNAHFAQPFMLAQDDLSSLPLPLGLSILALGLFWYRFKVPFAMALMALGVFGLAMLVAANTSGQSFSVEEMFLLSAGGAYAWITLVVGALVFALAMYFDMSDPHRVTRRSAQGFWLHVVAAPALINTIALSLMDRGDSTGQFLLLAVMIGFAIVAIVIDRRSFLIAAIGYIVSLAMTVFENDGAALTVLLLGLFLVALGAFWTQIRAFLLRRIFGFLPLDRLPPAH